MWNTATAVLSFALVATLCSSYYVPRRQSVSYRSPHTSYTYSSYDNSGSSRVSSSTYDTSYSSGRCNNDFADIKLTSLFGLSLPSS